MRSNLPVLKKEKKNDYYWARDLLVNGITIGKGFGNIASNTAIGISAIALNKTGGYNVAIGYQTLFSNTTGSSNTAVGSSSLYYNTSGISNTSVGSSSLNTNTTGSNNTSVGSSSLYLNTTGNSNTAVGSFSLRSNTTGSNNTSVGLTSLYSNTTGSNNTSVGSNSLNANTTGNSNTAVGSNSLYYNLSGGGNTVVGNNALYYNTTGSNNTAVGSNSLCVNTTGNNNLSIGGYSLYTNTTGVSNTAVGYNTLYSNSIGNYNIAIGQTSGFNITGSANIVIGTLNSSGVASPVYNIISENNYISMGSTAVTNAYIQVAWTVVSDARDKMNFKEVPHGLDFVNKLKPIQYQFKINRDIEEPTGDIHYGFKAQEILELEGDNPVIIDTKDADKLRYKSDNLIPVLVKAIQEQQLLIDSINKRLETLEGK